LIEVNGFLNVGVHTQIVAFHQVSLFPRGGENDHRDPLGTLVGADCLQDLQSVDLGELEIKQHESGRVQERPILMRTSAEKEVEGLGSVAGYLNAVGEFAAAEGKDGQLHILRAVVD
jgi:hypothetical protein